MNAPQIIYISLCVMTLTAELMNDGKPKTGKHSFGSSLTANALILALLWWGGFFGSQS